MVHFYSRPCGRGDCCGKRHDLRFRQFLLTPLREGRQQPIPTEAPAEKFLLTPLREGRRLPLPQRRRLCCISTHAPAGGATKSAGKFVASKDSISTHAPAGGATGGRASSARRHHHFYSRPCGRGDHSRSRSRYKILISTHAPAGGATPACGRFLSGRRISTHAPAGGATVGGIAMPRIDELFLLTPLREGRRVRRNLSSAR